VVIVLNAMDQICAGRSVTQNGVKWILNINKHASLSAPLRADDPTRHGDEARQPARPSSNTRVPARTLYSRIPLRAAADIFARRPGTTA